MSGLNPSFFVRERSLKGDLVPGGGPGVWEVQAFCQGFLINHLSFAFDKVSWGWEKKFGGFDGDLV